MYMYMYMCVYYIILLSIYIAVYECSVYMLYACIRCICLHIPAFIHPHSYMYTLYTHLIYTIYRYEITPQQGSELCQVTYKPEILELCNHLRIMAFDIECEKAPLKFPDASRDRIYMISYMIAGQGYLLINRELVSEDVSNFEYTPDRSKFPGPFEVINLTSEEEMLTKFVRHIQVRMITTIVYIYTYVCANNIFTIVTLT